MAKQHKPVCRYMYVYHIFVPHHNLWIASRLKKCNVGLMASHDSCTMFHARHAGFIHGPYHVSYMRERLLHKTGLKLLAFSFGCVFVQDISSMKYINHRICTNVILSVYTTHSLGL